MDKAVATVNDSVPRAFVPRLSGYPTLKSEEGAFTDPQGSEDSLSPVGHALPL